MTSHLLGELERVCSHVIVIDAGRLLHSSSAADVTAVSPVVAVEVDDGTEELADVLQVAGVRLRVAGRLLEVRSATTPRTTSSGTPSPGWVWG